jgi:hypothetical protein
VSKFVGKFRKNENYEEYSHFDKKRHRNDNNKNKKMINRMVQEDELYGDSHGSKDYRQKRREIY